MREWGDFEQWLSSPVVDMQHLSDSLTELSTLLPLVTAQGQDIRTAMATGATAAHFGTQRGKAWWRVPVRRRRIRH